MAATHLNDFRHIVSLVIKVDTNTAHLGIIKRTKE
jgi:hypothetical protein